MRVRAGTHPRYRQVEYLDFEELCDGRLNMSSIMAVLLNGIAQIKYDRDKLLPAHQAASVDRMDATINNVAHGRR